MTYYEVLNINKNASDKEIKNAYRALAKKYHPDTYQGNKAVAEEKMKQINEAYDVLSDKELKAQYDKQFEPAITHNVKEEKSSYSSYGYYEKEYRSPDPVDPKCNPYYNYSPDYEEDSGYDFSQLKILFQGPTSKVFFIVLGFVMLILLLIYMLGQIKNEFNKLLDETNSSFDVGPYQQIIIPQNNYYPEVQKPTQKEEKPIQKDENIYNSELPNTQNNYGYNQEEFEKALEEQLKNWETQYNEWYETDGKQYEEQIKQGLEEIFGSYLNQYNMNY